jgi:Domain of unknown function (DUF6438)
LQPEIENHGGARLRFGSVTTQPGWRDVAQSKKLDEYVSMKAPHMFIRLLGVAPLLGLLCFPAIASDQHSIPDDTVISLQRGNCEGGCPVYRVVIFANGDVIWQGRGRVAKLGVVLSLIERDRIRALIHDFESIDYFHLENIYGYRGSGCRASASDRPMVITFLSMDGLSKTLSHHDGCVSEVSEKLTALENSIDEAVSVERWIKRRPAKK